MTLLNFLKKDSARLIFGKSEIEIIKKQLNGLKLKPSEKVRLSRDIRKKLESVEELSRYKEEFKLKKSQEIKYLINEAKEIILEELKNNVNEIILFGSYAENKQTKNSDIDLAIKLRKISKLNPTKIRAALLGNMPSEKLDIQIYGSLPEKIKKEINKHGKTIFFNEQNKR